MHTIEDAAFDAISAADIFLEAKDRLQIVIDAESKIRPAAKEAIAFCWGDQWADKVSSSVSESDDIELTINLTGMLVRRVVNNLKQQRPRGKCHPVGDGATIEIAETIDGIGRHIEYRSEAGIAYDTAADMAAKAGFGYCRMVAEYVAPDSFQRDIRILPIFNIFTVYLDPSAMMPTASDMGWGFITIKMKRTEYKRLYPRADNVQWTDGERDKSLLEWESKEEIRLAEYFRIREKSEKLYSIKNAQGGEYTRFKSELPSPESLAAAGDQIVDERDSSRRQVEWFRLNGTKVIEREILPGEYIPIIRCINEQVDNDGEILRAGLVKDQMDPQRMVNYGEVAKIKRLALTPQAPWVYAVGQLEGRPEWTDTNNRAHPALGYVPVTVDNGQGGQIPLPPPQRQQPAQLESGFAEFTEGMRSNLLAIAGMQNEPGQDTRGQVVSGVAQQRRDRTSDMAHFQIYDNQTLMIAHVWRIMLSWIPYYFKEPGRIQRIIGEDTTPEMVTLNAPNDDPAVKALKNDLSLGRYDVVMDTGPGYETKREEGAETFIELLNSPLGPEIAKVGPDLAIRSIDHPYMQELADRFAAMTPEGLKKVMESLPERAKSIVQALANENAQLKQQLQAAESGVTKAHLAATVKAHDVEESNKTKRADTESRERTAVRITGMKEHGALAREEIKAGAELLNTHVEAKYHEREAERVIEAGETAERSNGNGSSR